MPRDPDFEREFIDEAARGAGLGRIGLKEAAVARLEQGAEEYGDRSFSLPLAELVDQIEEEAVDVACWSTIFAQADELGGLDDDTRYSATMLLISLTGVAAQQMFLVRELRNTLKR